MTENVKELQSLVTSLMEKTQNLEEQLHWFKRQVFGTKSEKLPAVGLVDMFGNEPEQVIEPDPQTEKISYSRKKPVKGHGRNDFPGHLEVKEVTIDIPETQKVCSCCGKQKKCIGNDESLKYEAIPTVIFIKKTIRPKYACPDCAEEGVDQAKMPLQVIPGGNCGTSLINHVVISKFLNHMPLERQSQDFKRQGISIVPSTMLGWQIRFCEVMTPVYENMKKELSSSRWMHTDDTGVPVKIKRKKGSAHKGIFWVYIGESTNVIFEYTHSRKSEGPRNFLKDYAGYLHADGYSGYDKLYRENKIKECACWSHGRRKFFDAYEAGDKRARRILELCGRLFLIERIMREKGYSYAEIKEVRNNLGRKITSQIKKWMDKHELEILPGNNLGKAMAYLRKNWTAFHTYMEEGFLSMDNNLSERQMRKVVLGRSNWIFCGSEEGAKRSALIYSIMCTCKLLEIDPAQYLNDVMEKILVPGVRMEELTPIQWKKGQVSPI